MREFIDAAAFKDMILCAEAALHANIQLVNELNAVLDEIELKTGGENNGR